MLLTFSNNMMIFETLLFFQVCFLRKKNLLNVLKTLKLYDLGHAKTYHQDDQGSHSMHNVFMLKAKKKTFLQTLMWQGNLEKHYA